MYKKCIVEYQIIVHFYNITAVILLIGPLQPIEKITIKNKRQIILLYVHIHTLLHHPIECSVHQ